VAWHFDDGRRRWSWEERIEVHIADVDLHASTLDVLPTRLEEGSRWARGLARGKGLP
jgi:hypothetical protein